MKHFRKHPDLILIANYPNVSDRIRHGRATTPSQLSKIFVNTITATLHRTKKILLLTDAQENKPHAGLIIRSWQSIPDLLNRLIYNFQAQTVCILYHRHLFGRMYTAMFMPLLLLFLRMLGKRTIVVVFTVPKLSPEPTLGQAAMYFARFGFRIVLTLLATTIIVGEKPLAARLGKKNIVVVPMTMNSLAQRHLAGKLICEELFPSPTRNLGLVHLLKMDNT